jgi:hypothetical protein
MNFKYNAIIKNEEQKLFKPVTRELGIDKQSLKDWVNTPNSNKIIFIY